METKKIVYLFSMTIMASFQGVITTSTAQIPGQNWVNFPGGADNYIAISNTLSLNFTSAITVEAWINIAF